MNVSYKIILLCIPIMMDMSIVADGYLAQAWNETPYNIYFDFGRAGCPTTRWDEPVPGRTHWKKSECGLAIFTTVSITKQHTGPTIEITLPANGVTGADDLIAVAETDGNNLILTLRQDFAGISAYTSKKAPLNVAQLKTVNNTSDKSIIMSPVKLVEATTFARAGEAYANAADPRSGPFISINPQQKMELPASIPAEYTGGYIEFRIGTVNGPRYTIQTMGDPAQIHLRGPNEKGQWTDLVFPVNNNYVLWIQPNGIPALVSSTEYFP